MMRSCTPNSKNVVFVGGRNKGPIGAKTCTLRIEVVSKWDSDSLTRFGVPNVRSLKRHRNNTRSVRTEAYISQWVLVFHWISQGLGRFDVPDLRVRRTCG